MCIRDRFRGEIPPPETADEFIVNGLRHEHVISERMRKQRADEIKEAVAIDKRNLETAHGRAKVKAAQQKEEKKARTAATRAANKQ